VVSVSDREIAAAVTLLAERAKTVAESAGAAPLAAALSDDLDLEGEHVGIIISGGNVNLTEHAELTRTGLHELERYTEARLALAGWPTSVGAVVETVEAEGSELDVLERARRTAVDYPNRTPVTIGLEGSGPGHLEGVLEALSALEGCRSWSARSSDDQRGRMLGRLTDERDGVLAKVLDFCQVSVSVNRLLVYHVSQIVVGGGLLLFAVSSVMGNGLDDAFDGIFVALMGISGIGIVLVNCYQLLRSDADPPELTPAVFRLSVAGAGLMVLAGILWVVL